ncbi:LacI family DNA-binding transcriptional regulator [Endozoicomonas montiporae]|uniref:HTH-type transcriptional regulator GalR n=1 Tax=Endozoicomonas montiporae CL-33 TaxID=570277 RepID=A0A142BHX7_9GAMM|nr:LacI family DNA-binding transcriptional regulator [Endozoicomonas montiporae]AMO58353.1 HTH-type transcriptional regulator GalR [Endozoicomonas montiporae CL-33]
MANIKDVAKLAGVSISTVSRVVNNTAGVAQNKKEAVQRAMSELHYKPNSFAKALVSNKSDTLGLVVGDLGNPFFSLLMRGVEKLASRYNKQLLISSGHHDPDREREAIRSLIDRRCDAIVVHSKALSDYQVMELLESQISSVIINRKIQGFEERCIYLDNRKAGEMATRYLLERGHRHIAIISRSSDNKQLELEDARNRYQGYQDALLAHGIIPEPELFTKRVPDEQGGYHATMELLDRKVEFSAIFAYNDAMAAGCMMALRERRVQVPNDVSVIGFDDTVLAHYLNPGLTTVRYPVEAMGEEAATLALTLFGEHEPIEPDCEAMSQEEVNRNKVTLEFLPEIQVRDSVRTL